MKQHLFTLIVFACFAPAFSAIGQDIQSKPANSNDSTQAPINYQSLYAKKKKSARGLMIGGSAMIVAGGIIGAVGYNSSQSYGQTGFAIGAAAVLIVGGITALITGMVVNGKANKIKEEKLSLVLVAPSLQIGAANISNTGVTLRWRYSK